MLMASRKTGNHCSFCTGGQRRWLGLSRYPPRFMRRPSAQSHLFFAASRIERVRAALAVFQVKCCILWILAPGSIRTPADRIQTIDSYA
jgi:hypothetical protein